MKKREVILIFSAIVLIVIIPFVLSAGGGGGGSSSVPSCSEDTWECSGWSSCNKDDLRSRTCAMTFDCTTADTPKPEESEDCKYTSSLVKKLKCGDLGTLQQRVACRLSLSPDQQQDELAIRYLPEECRELLTDGRKEVCIAQYGKVQPCWKIPPGDNRIKCVKQKLGLRELRLEKAQCQEKSANEKANCLHEFRGKSYAVIKFRLYDLEERAEGFLERGADKDLVTEFISSIEKKKIQFNAAKTPPDRKQVLLDTQGLWKQFLHDLKTGKKI